MTYEPESYWQKRLSKDFSLGGVGFLGLGAQYNKWLYKAKIRALSKLLEKRQVNPSGKRILDIGVGTGFYIEYWKQRGANFIVGLDITKKSVSALKIRYPNYKFIKADISSKELPIEGRFDIITAFDVLFHIVEEDKFEQAIKNIKGLSHKQTQILVSDSFSKKPWPLGFHENHRTMARYKEVLANSGLKPMAVVPIFYLMSNPADKRALKNGILETFLPRLWSVVHTICSLSPKLGIVGKLLTNLVGLALYTVDGIILKYAEVGPSTKLMLIRVE